ncbi:MAG TPA: GNAT family N-acetyltransferase [bacterium]|nr:GNAT family N-acetyltransferase [bacterium]
MASRDIRIEPMTPDDWEMVRKIYREGIDTGQATFETEVPDWETWDTQHLKKCRLVARSREFILGWAALSPISERCIYGGVAEVSIYVAATARGKGVGKQLLQALIAASERVGIWTLQAGVFPENQPSLALCKSCGFRLVGYRERIGRLHGQWRDVLLLERRSQVVGTQQEPSQGYVT